MSSTDVPTTTRTPARRLRLFVPFFIGSAVLAMVSLTKVWYAATMTSATVLGVQNVSAQVSLTGNQLAALASQPTTLTSSAPHPPTQLGVLAPVFWLVVAALCGVLACWMVSRLFGVLGAALALYAWQSLASTRGQVEQPRTWGDFTVVRGVGQSYLWFAMTVAVIGLVLVTIQVHIVKRSQKTNDESAPKTTSLGEILAKVMRTSVQSFATTVTAAQAHDELVKQ